MSGERPAAPSRGRYAALAALLAAAALGCTIPLATRAAYDYFVVPVPGDPWSAKIAGWQLREAADSDRNADVATPAVAEGERVQEVSAVAPASADAAASLRAKYAAFRAEHKRQIARSLFEWIQSEAKQHYVPDGPVDHWATLEETLRTNGDDCDGLELLVYNALRELGFANGEVFRAIVYRPADGQHHMVTLWFEEANDPWVIDPTGAMTAQMLRMSQIPEWVPLKLFDDNEEFTVRRVPAERPARPALAAR